MPSRFLAAIAAFSLVGCMVDLNTFELCERDPEACNEAAENLSVLAGCAATDPLRVEIGTGETDFAAFGVGEALQLHLGTPAQAWDLRHIFVGVRIANPDPVGGRFVGKFRITEPLKSEAGKDNPKVRDSVLRVVMQKSLAKAADGSLSRGGLRVFVYEQPLRLSVIVEDQCGRTATDVHDVAAGSP